uniref:MFS transporter n=1 Tax=Beijerinckia sp. L45 TaxID=1641855 RepID=UPI00131DC169
MSSIASTDQSSSPSHVAVIVKGGTLAMFLAASSAPTPLYHFYQERWSLSPAVLTTIFGIYALSLLVALLTIGSLSDHVGRRPVILVAIALNGLALILFASADSAAMLIAARALQGFATGAATSTLSAAVLDSDKRHGPLINSITPFIGMSVGALGSSALVAYAQAPAQAVYLLLLIVFAALAILVARLPETTAKLPGALASLRPRVHVPPQARRALLRITPVNIAVWSLGGFYLSLMPSLLRVALGTTSPFIGGIVVAALTLSGGIAIILLRHRSPTTIFIVGSSTLMLGVAVTLSGVALQSIPLLLGGTVVAGFGFGLGFFGALRTILPLAAPDERAGLVSAFFIQSYLAFSLPAILVGLIVPFVGLARATYGYGMTIILLAALSLAATLMARAQARSNTDRAQPVSPMP